LTKWPHKMYPIYVDHKKTFGWNVQDRFSLPPKSVEHCINIADVFRAIRLFPVEPALFKEVTKMWDDWRRETVSDWDEDPTPVEVDDVLWRFINDVD